MKTKESLYKFCGALHGQFLGEVLIRRTYRSRYLLDSVQMLCVLESVLDCNKVDIFSIANYLYERAQSGILKKGETLLKIISHKQFLENPHLVAYNYWQSNQQIPAGNGALVRAPITVLWCFDNIEKVKKQAAEVCKITHADPRCVASCIGIAMTVAYLIQGEENIEKIINNVEQEISHFHPDIPKYFNKIKAKSLNVFVLRNYSNYGYTLKTFGAALWCLKNASSFNQAINLLFLESDNSTDLSVVGALLGARFGIQGLPNIHLERSSGMYDNWAISNQLVSKYRNVTWLNKQAVNLYELNLKLNTDYVDLTPKNDLV